MPDTMKLNFSIGRLEGARELLELGAPISRPGLINVLAEVGADLESIRSEIDEGSDRG